MRGVTGEEYKQVAADLHHQILKAINVMNGSSCRSMSPELSGTTCSAEEPLEPERITCSRFASRPSEPDRMNLDKRQLSRVLCVVQTTLYVREH